MARTLFFGWETGSPLGLAEPGLVRPFGIVGSDLSIDTEIFRSGTASLKAVAVSGVNSRFGFTGTGATYRRIYIKATARPSSLSRTIIGNRIVTDSHYIELNPSGTLSLYKQGLPPTLVGTSITALTDTSKWYLVEYRIPSGSSTVLLKIDNNNEITASSSVNDYVGSFGQSDTIADTYICHFDDYGEDNSNWLGEGKVVLLIPISDNARDTLWKGGNGGLTNLFEAVNNKPPIGTASETDLTQIEHGGGAAGTTDRYDANMTAYSTAGIVAEDTINAVLPFIECGEDVATGTKNLSFNILSNPTTDNTGSFDVTLGTSGALGTGPTGWWQKTGPLGGAPDTLDSPVFRVIRPETASRVASVCFMGIYVDYTPAPPAAGHPAIRRFGKFNQSRPVYGSQGVEVF